MMYYKAPMASPINGDYLLFKGSTQYLQSKPTAQGGFDFKDTWSQPWTFFCRGINETTVGSIYFANSYTFNAGGLRIGHDDGNSTCFITLSGGNATSNAVRLFFTVNTTGEFTLQISFAGGPEETIGPSKFLIKFNNNIITPSVQSNTLNSNPTGEKTFRIRYTLKNTREDIIKHLSFVDYAKTNLELIADYNNEEQSLGSGSWILGPVVPRYASNGSKQIKTLVTANINNSLPNSNAFVISTGHKINLVGFPDPLVLGTNII